MAKHAVVRTDLMDGTDVRSQLVSIKYMGSNKKTPTEIDNGNVLKVGDLVEGEREVFVGEIPTAKDPITSIVLIASVEVMYDEHKQNLDEYVNEAGKILRGYRFNHGNIFSVTKEALEGSPDTDKIIELKAGTKLNVVKQATGAEATVVGEIIGKEVSGGLTFYVIKID